MKIFGIVMLVIWTLSFALTMSEKDKKMLKTTYIITWVVLMVQLIDNYIIN